MPMPGIDNRMAASDGSGVGVGGRVGLVRRRRLDELMHHPLELATHVRE